MHYLIGFITAVMVLFPASDSGGKSLYQLWMESYEKYLYQQMYDNLERERNEQTASEETTDKVADVEVGETLGADSDKQRETEAETVLQSEAVAAVQENDINRQDADRHESYEESLVREVTPLYSLNGEVLAEEIQVFLFQKLSESNIAYFMPYAMMICYQESKLDIYAENPNGRDKGLLQYRVEYVPWMDWRNPYQQIEYFVTQMANRAAAGCTVSEMISRHNTSDYGSYNQSYVDAVMQWADVLVRIR